MSLAMVLAVVFSGGPIQLPSGSTHINSAVATALVISIPSVVIALASYALSTRAKRETATATKVQIDAEAYTRARGLYESAIDTLRQELTDVRAENARLHGEMAQLHAELATRRPRPPRARS